MLGDPSDRIKHNKIQAWQGSPCSPCVCRAAPTNYAVERHLVSSQEHIFSDVGDASRGAAARDDACRPAERTLPMISLGANEVYLVMAVNDGELTPVLAQVYRAQPPASAIAADRPPSRMLP